MKFYFGSGKVRMKLLFFFMRFRAYGKTRWIFELVVRKKGWKFELFCFWHFIRIQCLG